MLIHLVRGGWWPLGEVDGAGTEHLLVVGEPNSPDGSGWGSAGQQGRPEHRAIPAPTTAARTSAVLGRRRNALVGPNVAQQLWRYHDIGGEVHPCAWADDRPQRGGRSRLGELVPAELDGGVVVVEVLDPKVARGSERERVRPIEGPRRPSLGRAYCDRRRGEPEAAS